MDYLEIVERICSILKKTGQDDLSRFIVNARIKGGGSRGEVLLIICSLLLVYKKKFPAVYTVISKDADFLFSVAKTAGLFAKADERLLDELDWYE